MSIWYISGAFVQKTSSKDVNQMQRQTKVKRTVQTNWKTVGQIVQASKLIFTDAALICLKPFRLLAEQEVHWLFLCGGFARNLISIATFITEAAPCPWTLLVIKCLLNKTLLLQTLLTTSATKTSIPLVMNLFTRQQWSLLSYQPQQ